MDERFFDDLAKELDDSSVSRRRALKLVGAALLSSALMPLLPKPAYASARKRCHKHGGVFLSKGQCHCASQCGSATVFACHNTITCSCGETAERTGFCAANGSLSQGCWSSTECSGSSGARCIVTRGCPDSGGSCTPATVTTDCPPNYGCINGTCQLTNCQSPCPR
jgi:hypothetical protein